VARLTLLALLLLAAPARAWDNHRALTALAVRDLPALDASVTVETLDSFLAATNRPGGTAAFLKEHKLNPQAALPWLLNESAGQTVTLRAVVAGYADEPDWGIDQDLFAAYPELWKENYKYMGGRTGTQTRAFRHMFWPQGFYKEPLPGGKLPIHDATPLGEAPDRAQVFFDLSKAAFQSGHPYWGARFLSWSLHYYQDLTMPFHAVQLPSTDFLQFKPDGSLDLELTTRWVIYAHLCLDAFPARAASGSLGPDSGAGVVAALAGRAVQPIVSARALSVAAANTSAAQSRRSGLDTLEFFPEPDGDTLKDPLGVTQDAGFWTALAKQITADPAAGKKFTSLATDLLSASGPAIRGLVMAAMAPPRVNAINLQPAAARVQHALALPLPR
jgi:hypothetical protein